MPEWIKAAWLVAVFFLGQASTFLASSINEKRQIAREAKSRQAEREKSLTERRETFELDHLERLNEALQRLGRAVGRVHFLDAMSGRDSGQYAGALLPEEDSNALLDANRDVFMLKGLVLDDALRAHVGHACELLNEPSSRHRSDPEASEAAFRQAILALDDAQSAIAQRIRQIYLTASLPEVIA